jgi:hypothetical protein
MSEEDEHIQESEPMRRRLTFKTVPTPGLTLQWVLLLVGEVFAFLVLLAIGDPVLLAIDDPELCMTVLAAPVIMLFTVFVLLDSLSSEKAVLDEVGVHWKNDPGLFSGEDQRIPWRELRRVRSLGTFPGTRWGDVRLVAEGEFSTITFHCQRFSLRQLKTMFFAIVERKKAHPQLEIQDNCKWLLQMEED